MHSPPWYDMMYSLSDKEKHGVLYMSKRSSLTDQTASLLYNQIVSERKYAPGDRLPSENILAEELGISRTTLREAIRLLTAQGLLNVRRGSGTYVSDVLDAQTDPDIRKLESLRIQAKDLYELRLIFEPATAKLACMRATDEERGTIIALGQQVVDELSSGNHSGWQTADLRFHHAIVRATHNDFFCQLIPLISRAFPVGLAMAEGSERTLREIPKQDNPDICQAFASHDPDFAEMAMSLHIKHVMQTVL